MIAIFFKFGLVLAVIAAVVFGLSSKRVRTPIFDALHKARWQILVITVCFITILIVSSLGT